MVKRKTLLRWLVLIMAAFVLMSGGCGGGGSDEGGGGDDVSTPEYEPVVYEPGVDKPVATRTIGAGGDKIQAGSTGTPIDGVVVTFPAGALTADTEVSLGYNEGLLTPNEGTWNGVTLTLDTGSVRLFERPVSVTVPFDVSGGLAVQYYITTKEDCIRLN